MASIQCPELDTSALTLMQTLKVKKINDIQLLSHNTFHGYLSSTIFCTYIHRSVVSDSRDVEQLMMATTPFSVEIVVM
jgi:hypothetical protein